MVGKPEAFGIFMLWRAGMAYATSAVNTFIPFSNLRVKLFRMFLRVVSEEGWIRAASRSCPNRGR